MVSPVGFKGNLSLLEYFFPGDLSEWRVLSAASNAVCVCVLDEDTITSTHMEPDRKGGGGVLEDHLPKVSLWLVLLS